MWLFDKKKLKTLGPDFNFTVQAVKPVDNETRDELIRSGRLINYS